MMMGQYFSSQRGFSLVKILVPLLLAAVLILYFMPYIAGSRIDILNEVSAKVKGVVNNLISKVFLLKDKFGNTFETTSIKLSRTLANLFDRLKLSGLAKLISDVKVEWEGDMQSLIDTSRSRGFDMQSIEASYDEYTAGQRSWRRVEAGYWEAIREQTRQAIEKSFRQFLNRPVGCSDYTVELKKVWEIGNRFNEDTFEGYLEAKRLSEELYNPRSVEFMIELLSWLSKAGFYPAQAAGNWEQDWYVQQLLLAITPQSDGYPPDYPQIIQQIDQRASAARNPIERIVADSTAAEIYLNYDLINSTIERHEESLRNLSALSNQYAQGNSYSMVALGLHMTLGLLHERLCTNADLAIKEFKDVVAIASRLGLPCKDYYSVHYHLAIMNLQIRTRSGIKLEFVTQAAPMALTTTQLLQPSGGTAPTEVTPTPDAVATPSADGVVKGTIDGSGRRSIVEATPTPRDERPIVEVDPLAPTPTPSPVFPPTYAPGEIKKGTGTGRTERDIRLRPRQELGDSLKMQTFTIDKLYDLSKIPADAVREFELFLKCQSAGEEVEIARYVINTYSGR